MSRCVKKAQHPSRHSEAHDFVFIVPNMKLILCFMKFSKVLRKIHFGGPREAWWRTAVPSLHPRPWDFMLVANHRTQTGNLAPLWIFFRTHRYRKVLLETPSFSMVSGTKGDMEKLERR